jgi:predicted nucleic acid-binding protein
MRTTVALPDYLLKRAKIAAVRRGTSLRELVGAALEPELSEPEHGARPGRVRFPIFPSTSPGALRLTNARVAALETAEDVWRGWQRLREDDRFALSSEPAGLEDAWRALSAALPKGTPAETDCYLAAFAIAGAHSLVSFDRRMRRFKGLDVVTPS